MDLFPLIESAFQNNKDIRVVTNLKTSRAFSEDCYTKARLIHLVLAEIRKNFSKRNTPWKKELSKKADLSVSDSTIKDWFLGRASIPFNDLKSICKFANQEQIKKINENTCYFCTKTSSIARFPRKNSKDLAWLVAAILCDGHMKKNCEGICFEVSDLVLCNKFCKTFARVFETKIKHPSIRNRIDYNQTHTIHLNNVPSILFLNKLFEIPLGKKCPIIKVPKLIFESNNELKRTFLKGVFDTDGGKRGGGLGLTSLSEKFVDNVSELLEEFEINPHKESWINKKYNKKCFGVRFKIDAHSIFLMRQN